MVKFVKDFILQGDQRDIYETLRTKIPEYLNREEEDGYHIMEEIEEEEKYYRKAKIEKRSFLKKFPQFFLDKLPQSLLETSTKLMEETIFFHKELKIQWTISSQLDDIYVLHGTTRFINSDPQNCKVLVLMFMELKHLEHYFPNQVARNLITPFLESKVPTYFLSNLKDVYKQIVHENSFIHETCKG